MKRLFIAFAAALVLAGCAASAPETIEASIPGPVRTIPAQIQKPALRPGEKAPFVVICHGLTGNLGEEHLTRLSDSLLVRGIGSVRFNFNGHGDDETNFVHHTISREVSEALAVFDYVSELEWVDESRMGIAGHSQGGVVAGITAGELGSERLACLALLAPAACIHTNIVSGTMFGLVIPSDELEALSKAAAEDPAAPQGVPFWGGRTLGWDYIKDAMNLDMHALAARFTGPSIIVQGTADDPGLIADSKAYCDYMSDVQYVALKGLSHCYPEDYALAALTAAEFLAAHLQ